MHSTILCGNMTLVTGGVKTGKSLLSVCLAYKTYKKNLMLYKLQKPLRKLFKKPPSEKPLLYSNIPLKCEYVPLTEELMKREKRFNYRSVIYVCESSLVADSMSYKDEELNERMLLLNKLIAHETRGGSIFYDTQSIGDNHFAIRRCLSDYIHIVKKLNLPFFMVLFYQRMQYMDGETTINSTQKADEIKPKYVIIPKKKYFKMYDRYCYSIMTDHLETVSNKTKPNKHQSLKAEKLVSFKKWRTIKNDEKN